MRRERLRSKRAGRAFVVHNAQINRRVLVVAGCLAVVSLIAGTQVSQCQAQRRGLPNFGRVTESLYRGAQPASEGFNELRSMGVGMVINFRDDHSETEKEKRTVESLGMKYAGIPWSANHAPSNVQIVEFLDLIRANPNMKIFVHCRRGADRTGVMVAAYRIAVEHRPVAEVVSEMRKFHYDWFFRPHLKRYIEALPELLRRDPEFAAYRQEPSNTR